MKLVNPFLEKDFFKNDALVRETADKKSVFVIPLNVFFTKKLVERAKLISQTKAFLKKCLKLKAKFVFSLEAKTPLEEKSERELIAIIITCFGLSREQAVKALMEGKNVSGEKK